VSLISARILSFATLPHLVRQAGLHLENTISNASSYSQTIVYDPVYDLIGRFEQIGYGETGTYYLYKPDNPNVVKTFTIGQNAVSYSIYHVLLNGHLLCSTGFIAPLSYFYP
jgi:hypothetical protein